MTAPLPDVFIEPRSELREAELAAAECLRRCLASTGLTQCPLPVPAEKWVEHPLGFDYGFETIAKNSTGMLTRGYALLGTKVIRINEAVANRDTKVRWTTAHEIGHHILHTKPSFRNQPVSTSTPGWRYHDVWERQADRFAAAFLIPPRLLVREFFAVCRAVGWDAEEALTELVSDSTRATVMWTETAIPRFARVFGVREAAVVYRLSDLRLFDDAPLLLPRHVHRLGLLKPAV